LRPPGSHAPTRTDCRRAGRRPDRARCGTRSYHLFGSAAAGAKSSPGLSSRARHRDARALPLPIPLSRRSPRAFRLIVREPTSAFAELVSLAHSPPGLDRAGTSMRGPSAIRDCKGRTCAYSLPGGGRLHYRLALSTPCYVRTRSADHRQPVAARSQHLSTLKGRAGFEYHIDTSPRALLAEPSSRRRGVSFRRGGPASSPDRRHPVHTIEPTCTVTEVVLSTQTKRTKLVLIASTSEVSGKANTSLSSRGSDLVLGTDVLSTAWAYGAARRSTSFSGAPLLNERKLR